MELIDGYGDMKCPVDLIDKDTNKSSRDVGELHDGFINYLNEHEEKNKVIFQLTETIVKNKGFHILVMYNMWNLLFYLTFLNLGLDKLSK